MDPDELSHGIQRALENIATRIDSEEEYLTELDSLTGDGDYGVNLQRGFRASVETSTLNDSESPAELLAEVGETLLDEVGGSSGLLLGMPMMTASGELNEPLTEADIVAFAEVYRDEVADRGEVSVGAKTMFDAIVPVVEVLRASTEAGLSPVETTARLVEAARRGAMYTAPIRATRGRASYTDLRSVGHPDPGAVGVYIIVEEIHETVQEITGESVEPGMEDRFDRGPPTVERIHDADEN